MIPSVAIDAYLARDLDSHLWMKGLPAEDVDRALAALDPAPWIWSGTRLHQKVSILLGIAYPGFGFWIDMGGGKTLVALTLLRYWWDTGALRRALVFVTSDKAFLTWEKQIRRFGIDIPYVALEGSSEQKWRALDELHEGLVLLTRPGAVAMCSEKRAVKKKGKAKATIHLRLIPAKTEKLSKWAGAVVWDESTREGNTGSLQYRLADQLRKATPRRYLLAGRPFGRDPTMLVPQYKLIDDGETLGETLGLFRAVFCDAADNAWDPKGYAKDYTFRKEMHGELSRMIQHRSITYTADECVDLPDVIPIVEEVSFPTEAQAYYRRVVKELIKAKGNYRAAKNAFLRMRQVSSGFVGVHDDETGAKAEIEFAENPKLDWLLDLLEDLPEERKACVFYAFTWSGRRIVKALQEELGDQPIWLWSGTKDVRKELTRFFEDPKCRTAVIQNQVGAFSLDGLQDVASYTFFYESPVSPIDREQAERRLERDGQKHKVMRYDIVVRGSMDQRILDFHAEGASLMDAIMRDPARYVTEES
jgi:hypothetical protein